MRKYIWMRKAQLREIKEDKNMKIIRVKDGAATLSDLYPSTPTRSIKTPASNTG